MCGQESGPTQLITTEVSRAGISRDLDIGE